MTDKANALSKLADKLSYRVENPSAWPEGFDQAGSDLFREAATTIRAFSIASNPLQSVLDRFQVAAASGSTKEELLPCPFCGGGSVSVHGPRGSLGAWVACSSCGLETPTETGVTTEQAFAYWNRRASALESTPAPVSEITEDMVDGKALLAAINKLPRCVMETHSNNGDVFVSLTKVRAALTAAMGGE
jgi:Lar family restriction alleviation protein